ncbi:DUF302 domain-containing protein [bacterium]|nr:DUF302 domain-containing protein [bacterium]
MEYGWEVHLTESFDVAVERVTALLAEQGFGILTRIDVDATLKKKIGVDFPRYAILGACNPKLAHRALSGDPHVGLLLPCNVVVRDAGNGTTAVEIADPAAMFKIVDNPDVAPVAEEAAKLLRTVFHALQPN